MKIITLALAILLALTPACAETPDFEVERRETSESDCLQSPSEALDGVMPRGGPEHDDTAYSNFAGRLYIPEVNIDVALYRSNKQYVVDRTDSAAYFDLANWRGHMVIADHNTQCFATLLDVTVGMEAIIAHPDGTETHYICVDVFDGHNTGRYISDWSGKIVMRRADVLMYTCLDWWEDVRVTLWEETETPEGQSSGA